MANSRSAGRAAEQFVVTVLKQQGNKILAQNYQQMFGEIDIIAANKTHVLFVEVKLRTKPLFAMEELITPSKQQKIIKTAHHFLSLNHFSDKICQFDVALVELIEDNFKLTYIPNAFMQSDIRGY